MGNPTVSTWDSQANENTIRIILTDLHQDNLSIRSIFDILFYIFSPESPKSTFKSFKILNLCPQFLTVNHTRLDGAKLLPHQKRLYVGSVRIRTLFSGKLKLGSKDSVCNFRTNPQEQPQFTTFPVCSSREHFYSTIQPMLPQSLMQFCSHMPFQSQSLEKFK